MGTAATQGPAAPAEEPACRAEAAAPPPCLTFPLRCSKPAKAWCPLHPWGPTAPDQDSPSRRPTRLLRWAPVTSNRKPEGGQPRGPPAEHPKPHHQGGDGEAKAHRPEAGTIPSSSGLSSQEVGPGNGQGGLQAGSARGVALRRGLPCTPTPEEGGPCPTQARCGANQNTWLTAGPGAACRALSSPGALGPILPSPPLPSRLLHQLASPRGVWALPTDTGTPCHLPPRGAALHPWLGRPPPPTTRGLP